jgi:IS30 family transposase
LTEEKTLAPNAPGTVTPEQKHAFQNAVRPSGGHRNDRNKVRELWPEIRQKLVAGWSVKEVWQALRCAVDVQCTIRTFYRYIKESSDEAAADPACSASRAQKEPRSPSPPQRKSITEILNEGV